MRNSAYIAAAQAIENSGLDLSKIDKDEVGVIWGAGIGGLDTFSSLLPSLITIRTIQDSHHSFIQKMIANMASETSPCSTVSGVQPFTTVTACASATHAMNDAATYIRLGKASIFIAGGSEAAITQAGVGWFQCNACPTTRNDDPKTASRPFDKDRDGFANG